MLHGGLKASCSMADYTKVAAPWQIWAAIKGVRSMADFGMPSKGAAAWQIWAAIDDSPRVFELSGSKTPQIGYQQKRSSVICTCDMKTKYNCIKSFLCSTNKCKTDKTRPLSRCFKAETMQQLNNIKLSRRKKLDYLEQFMCINIF
jgi:hypothetical protein